MFLFELIDIYFKRASGYFVIANKICKWNINPSIAYLKHFHFYIFNILNIIYSN